MVQIESKVDKHFYFKSRMQLSSYQTIQKRTHGFLVLQDIGYDGRKVDLSFRTALFDSDDFENRQYTYEKDVLYAFNFPFYYGKGMRNYAIAKVNLSKQITFWIKSTGVVENPWHPLPFPPKELFPFPWTPYSQIVGEPEFTIGSQYLRITSNA